VAERDNTLVGEQRVLFAQL